MSKGTRFASEAVSLNDPATGTRVWQVTSHASINHPSYFLHRCFLPGDERLFFTSYRTGTPQLFLADFPDGGITQITDGPAIHPFSAALHPAGAAIVFARGGSFWLLHLHGLREELIIDVPGTQFGEPSISPDGEWLTAAYRRGEERGLATGRVDGAGGGYPVSANRDPPAVSPARTGVGRVCGGSGAAHAPGAARRLGP